jgi:hypothetical protein
MLPDLPDLVCSTPWKKRMKAKPKAASENGPESSSEEAAFGGIAGGGREVLAGKTGTPS